MKKIYLVFLFTIVAIMLINPSINISENVYLRAPDLLMSIALALYTVNGDFSNCDLKTLLIPIIGILYLFILLFAVELYYNYNDGVGFLFLIRSPITILASYNLISILWNRLQIRTIDIFFKFIIVCCIIQGFILWASYLSDNFRDLMSVFFYRDIDVNNEHLVKLRVPGFVSSGGDGLSLNHGLLCLVSALGIQILSFRKTVKIIISIAIILSALGNSFTGRSGLYLSLIFIFSVILLYKDGCIRLSGNIIMLLLFILFGAFLVVELTPVLGDIGLNYRLESGYEHPIARLLNLFVDFEQRKTYVDETIVALLSDHLIFPDTVSKILLGSNNFGQNSVDVISSDIGYIKMIHGFGLLGLIIFLLATFAYPIMKIRRNLKNLIECSTKNTLMHTRLKYICQIVVATSLYGIVAHWKIFFLSTRVFEFVFFSLVFMTVRMIKFYYTYGFLNSYRRVKI